jgi:hypothetical protein
MHQAYRSGSRRASRRGKLIELPTDSHSHPPVSPRARADEPEEGTRAMQVTVTVSDAIVREAGVRGMPVIDFVESLIDKGMSAAQGRPVLDSAMERIRALRASTPAGKR